MLITSTARSISIMSTPSFDTTRRQCKLTEKDQDPIQESATFALHIHATFLAKESLDCSQTGGRGSDPWTAAAERGSDAAALLRNDLCLRQWIEEIASANLNLVYLLPALLPNR